MPALSKLLIGVGLGIAGLGVLLWLAPGLKLGRLPGDIRIERGNFSFYLPLTTCLLLSVLFTLAMKILTYFRR